MAIETEATSPVDASINAKPVIHSYADQQLAVNDAGEFEGYACTWAYEGDGYTLRKGAMAKTIAERMGRIPVKGINHDVHDSDPRDTIGWITEAKEDEKGLWVKVKLIATKFAQDIRDLAQKGGLRGLSVEADVLQSVQKAGSAVREVVEARLNELTVTNRCLDKASEIVIVRAESEAPKVEAAATPKPAGAVRITDDELTRMKLMNDLLKLRMSIRL